MKNFFTILVSACFSISVLAQDYSSNWEDFFSYYEIVDLHSNGNRVFAAAKNSVFGYNTLTGEIKKYSTVNGLSAENITTLHYSSGNNLLIIGYETGLINVFNLSTGDVLQVIDITEKETVSPERRRVNDFYEINDHLLISTNYGISEFDLLNLEFGDTYFIGNAGDQLAVDQLVVFDDTIYAATQGGSVRYASINNPNLIDFSQWEATTGFPNVKNIVEFNSSVYAISNSNTLLQLQNNNLSTVTQLNGNATNLSTSSSTLLITFTAKIEAYNPQLNSQFTINSFEFDPSLSSALLIDNQLFIGDRNEGLVSVSLSNLSTFSYLSPVGPLLNNTFNMEAIPNELWVTFGEYSATLNPYPLNRRGVSHLMNDEWINLFYEELNMRSIGEVTIDPANPSHVFLSSFIDGLVEIENNEVINTYTINNSNLETFIDTADPLNPIQLRLNGTTFDNEGNLWVVNSKVENGLARLPNSSSDFQNFNITDVINDPISTLGLTKIEVTNSGNVFFGSSGDGVIGFESSSQTFSKVDGGENAGNLPDDHVVSLALDNSNQLWIGTLRGLRVLFNPSAMFTSQDIQAQEIIILDDDGVAQELLANIGIADIEVDGNNNKWIATESGAFYLSSNGQETIYNFTTENSPLPTNRVNDIEVDGSSGRVYFGTPQGIVAFNGTATSAQETLENVRAFPNPVRPTYSGLVTIDGLMDNANVKITDIEGNLVYEEVSEGGSIQWDTRAFGKHKVASGVYMVLITSADQLETKVTKIMIIR